MKKNVGTLLAVTLAAAPVAAGPMHVHPEKAKHGEQDNVEAAKPDPWAGTKHVTTVPPHMPDSFRRMQAQMIVDGVFAAFRMTTPRVLRNGSPACGNVQTKSPRPCKEDE